MSDSDVQSPPSVVPHAASGPKPIRRWLFAAAALGAFLVAAVTLVVGLTGTTRPDPAPPAPPATPPGDGFPHCDGVESHYALKGTDCRAMPVVTAPGALGPANTGGPAGGIDWAPAYPGSNVWIPEYQISGRLFVRLPGSGVPPPEGYELIGETPDGAELYWREDAEEGTGDG